LAIETEPLRLLSKQKEFRTLSQHWRSAMVMNNLHDVFVETIKDLYHAEKQLVKALPRMANAATSDELRAAIEEHLEVTEGQVERLEEVFGELDMSPKAKVCYGMQGIVEEGKEVLEEQKNGNPAAIDAAIIAAAQKVEHYEIASYGSARAFAETLGLNRIAELLQETLDEEEETDEKLNDLAESSINEAAAEASDEDEESDEEVQSSGSRSGSTSSSSRGNSRSGSKSSRRR
jgi:ferritin-like metal-binding protein YciE